MALSIVAAKDIEQAFEILSASPRKAVKDHLAEEPEEVGKFIYDFRAAFTNYECYYRFDPYRDILLEIDQVSAVKVFSDSVIKWLAEHDAEENSVIQRYGVSFPKIRRFAADLGHVCDAALEHGCELIGIKKEKRSEFVVQLVWERIVSCAVTGENCRPAHWVSEKTLNQVIGRMKRYVV